MEHNGTSAPPTEHHMGQHLPHLHSTDPQESWISTRRGHVEIRTPNTRKSKSLSISPVIKLARALKTNIIAGQDFLPLEKPI